MPSTIISYCILEIKIKLISLILQIHYQYCYEMCLSVCVNSVLAMNVVVVLILSLSEYTCILMWSIFENKWVTECCAFLRSLEPLEHPSSPLKPCERQPFIKEQQHSANAANMADKKQTVDLGLLEEDDEFEEFPAEGKRYRWCLKSRCACLRLFLIP